MMLCTCAGCCGMLKLNQVRDGCCVLELARHHTLAPRHSLCAPLAYCLKGAGASLLASFAQAIRWQTKRKRFLRCPPPLLPGLRKNC